MRAAPRPRLRFLFALVLPIAIAACAPAPLYKTGPSSVTATPLQVASSPQNFRGLEVVWGGTIVSVRNFPDHSEVEVLARPLDSSQRPLLDKPAAGRFIAIVPGFVEPLNFPAGAPVTLRGTLEGAREGAVGQAGYAFPLVHSDTLHRWTAEQMREGHPNISIGVGVGGWIR